MATNIKEIWKPVVNFEGLYEVSNLGRVRSLPRATTRGGIRRLCNGRRGYKLVNLTGNGRRISAKVHQLVLEAFVGTKRDGDVCRHINGNPSDNRLCNLAWGTIRQNHDDMRRHGTIARGAKNGNAKLHRLSVIEIKRGLRSGLSNRELAMLWGVSDAAISCIRTGKTWRHVG